tara:strand:+ start:98 stop:277 length:180 start_codon:yes stop_codon:yes gene_type:complete
MSVKKQYVNILDIKFYVCDENGNAVLDKDGYVKEFYCDKLNYDYLFDDVNVEDLEEIKE